MHDSSSGSVRIRPADLSSRMYRSERTTRADDTFGCGPEAAGRRGRGTPARSSRSSFRDRRTSPGCDLPQPPPWPCRRPVGLVEVMDTVGEQMGPGAGESEAPELLDLVLGYGDDRLANAPEKPLDIFVRDPRCTGKRAIARDECVGCGDTR